MTQPLIEVAVFVSSWEEQTLLKTGPQAKRELPAEAQASPKLKESQSDFLLCRKPWCVPKMLPRRRHRHDLKKGERSPMAVFCHAGAEAAENTSSAGPARNIVQTSLASSMLVRWHEATDEADEQDFAEQIGGKKQA